MDIIDPKNVQQGTDLWKELRLGHVTASNVADVMAKGKSGEAESRKKYKMRIVAERLTRKGESGFSNAAMEWGVEQEPYARMAYEVTNNTLVDQTGFWHHPQIAYVGVSPDGLVGDDGLVEIKCPNTTTHLDYLFDDEVPSKYYKQIQCQLWVTGRQWCDFVSYDPRLPERNQLFIKRCPRDEEFIAEMQTEVLAFLGEVEEMIKLLLGDINE
jgi:putative phage-type endonuclease